MKLYTLSDYKKEPITNLVEGSNLNLRRFIASFAATAILIALILIMASVYSNPYGYFGPVGQPATYNGRLAKVEYLSKLPKDQIPDAWIIGSSSTLPFQPETVNKLFSVKRTFNLGSFWGRAEDFWAWSNFILRDLNARPKLVILGVEPWTFADDRRGPPLLLEYRRRLIVTPQLAKYLPGFSTLKYQAAKILDSLTLQNLQIVLRMFKKYKFSRKSIVPLGAVGGPFNIDGTNRIYNNRNPRRFLPDRVNELYKQETPEGTSQQELYNLSTSRQRAVKAAYLELRKVFNYLPGDRLQQEDLELFRKTIQLLQSYDVKIIITILPTHPYLFDLLTYYTKHVAHLETIRQFLNGIKNEFSNVKIVYDASHIANFGGSPYDFYDRLHMSPVNTDRILKKIRQQTGSL